MDDVEELVLYIRDIFSFDDFSSIEKKANPDLFCDYGFGCSWDMYGKKWYNEMIRLFSKTYNKLINKGDTKKLKQYIEYYITNIFNDIFYET